MFLVVKSEYRQTLTRRLQGENILNDWLSFLSESHLRKLINLNYDLEELCIRVPYKYEKGDYVTCLDEISYKLEDVYHADTINKKHSIWAKNKTFKVDRFGGGGIVLFQKSDPYFHASGVFINWVRPATEEEIKRYEEDEKLKNK